MFSLQDSDLKSKLSKEISTMYEDIRECEVGKFWNFFVDFWSNLERRIRWGVENNDYRQYQKKFIKKVESNKRYYFAKIRQLNLGTSQKKIDLGTSQKKKFDLGTSQIVFLRSWLYFPSSWAHRFL